MASIIRQFAEQEFAAELNALKAVDTYPKPANWQLSPWAVLQYIMGTELENGFKISPKYIGNVRLIEVAIASLTTERALLLLGVPGTAKTWVAEHLAAAISGDSSLLIQGSAGMGEESIRYSWNYAQLLAKGPSKKAMIPSPVLRAMEMGKIARIEELTRISADVQDTLITILSEKMLPIPELDEIQQARQGFNIIATANDRDQGVNELSSALKRRFNTVVLPLPASLEEEVSIVSQRVNKLQKQLELPHELNALEEIQRLVTVFRELRSGQSIDQRTRLKSPSATLSSAEAISVMTHGLSLAAHFGDGQLKADDWAAGMVGAIVKEPESDQKVLQEYLETIVKERDGWMDIYRACKALI
ncbi:MAG: AAA family ATPase [Bacteroidota bacterium]